MNTKSLMDSSVSLRNGLYPEIPMLSEENKEVAFNDRKDWEYYWCIDHIDGTKEFIKRMMSLL
ncbi:MAG: inositol monophosphatase family protein [Sulfurimonas sp.]|nr:inositol monophosphatase family protein [Sulfurimonas sp.]